MIKADKLPERLANILEARGIVDADFTRDVVCSVEAGDAVPRLARWDEARLGPIPTQAEVDAASDGSEERRIVGIKIEAQRRIYARYLPWKQANMLARAIELSDKRINGQTLTTAESAEADALRAAWKWVKSVRAVSDAAEATPGMMADQVVWPA